MKKLLSSIIIICVVLLMEALPFMAKQGNSAQVVWRLNSWFPPAHDVYPDLKWACDEISKRSNGRLLIEIYPSFALGFKPTNWMRDHKDGLIDISMLFDLYTCGEEPSFCVLEVDHVFKQKEQQLKAADALFDFKRRVYKDVWNTELIAAGFVPDQTSVIATKGKQVKNIGDLKGLKIRVSSIRIKELLAALGASPQFIPKGDLYMALKTGVVDGFHSGYGSLYDEKLHEVFDYVVATGICTTLQQDIVVSRRVWDPLPEDLRKIVRDVFAEWAVRTKKDTLSGRTDKKDKESIQGAGRICVDLSDEEKAKIRDLTFKLHAAWIESQGGRVAEAWQIVKPFLKE